VTVVQVPDQRGNAKLERQADERIGARRVHSAHEAVAMRLDEIPTFASETAFHVVVESPRGSSMKLKYDPTLDAITLSRPLPSGVVYPHDWGFVPGTRASDGDPVDALIVSDGGTAPGVVATCRALEVDQKRKTGEGRERNDRIIAVPQSARRLDVLQDVFALSERVRDEIAAFFVQATAFEGKDVKILGWKGPPQAIALITIT
jgi:inorganic pyrophosphatase